MVRWMLNFLINWTAMIAVTTGAHAFSERDVRFTSAGQEVVATLATPQGAPAPVVLLLHGFTGSRNELKTEHVPDGVFGYAAQVLAQEGFASLRIDFRGSGESVANLTFAETTFEGQIADAFAAVDYLRGLSEVRGEDIYVVGWSQGGLVAAALSGRGASVDAVALWAAVVNPTETYGDLLGHDTIRRGRQIPADESVMIELPWGAKVQLNGAFFEGIHAIDPALEIATFAGPLFVAQGSRDTIVLPRSAEVWLAAHEGEEQHWRAEMDHVFNTFSDDEMLGDLINATVEFFIQHDD